MGKLIGRQRLLFKKGEQFKRELKKGIIARKKNRRCFRTLIRNKSKCIAKQKSDNKIQYRRTRVEIKMQTKYAESPLFIDSVSTCGSDYSDRSIVRDYTSSSLARLSGNFCFTARDIPTSN